MEQYPIPGSIHNQNFLTSGPMSRYCVDLLPMYRILAAGNAYKLKLDTRVMLINVTPHYIISLQLKYFIKRFQSESYAIFICPVLAQFHLLLAFIRM